MLGLYSNIAIAWIMAVVADLVINKPLGLSPRASSSSGRTCNDINPVGVGAMVTASVLSFVAHLGLLGPVAQAFSALIALVTALLVSPLLAWATGGRYYIARVPDAPVLAPTHCGLTALRCPGGWICLGRPGGKSVGLRTRSGWCLPRPAVAAVCDLRAWGLRSARHGALPGLPGAHLLAVLHARCPLWRHVQAARAAVGAVVGGAARCCPGAWAHLDAGLAHYILLMG